MAKKARFEILDHMEAAIAEPREELSPYAPRIFMIEIHPDRIGDVIGPGGKVIKKIQAETGAKIDIEQTGKVYIACLDAVGGERARKMIEDLTRDVRVGEVYLGRVTRMMNFGAFVEVLPGKEGLVHVSQLAPFRVERPEDVVKIGDEITVKVAEIDSQGRINLTRKGVLTPEEEEALAELGAAKAAQAPGRDHDPDRDRGPGGGGGGGRRGGGGGGGGRGGGNGGRPEGGRPEGGGGGGGGRMEAGVGARFRPPKRKP
jgi:polyribonucleotide nucleotidyltransferase